MRLYKFLLLLAVASTALMSCQDRSSQTRIAELTAERDSLDLLAEERDHRIADMNAYFDSVSACLDSIVFHEQLLLPVVDPETNKRFTRKEITERLNLLGSYIAQQRERIRMLTDSLNDFTSNGNGVSLSNMVAYLTSQLEEKESYIHQLLQELNQKNRDISSLTSNMRMLEGELSQVRSTNEALKTTVVQQTEIINEGYVLIGDKKRLQQTGALSSGGLLRKSRFNPEDIDLGACQKVDISRVQSIPMSSKKAKILSAVPAGTYHWETSGERVTLVIDNPGKFWSLSSILVIQLK